MIYGKLNMRVQGSFTSNYALALYENCARYVGISNTPWISVDLFRKLMGISEDKYVIFRDFKRRVIDKAVEEVNTLSELRVEPKFRKRGRKVVSLRFSISKRQKKHVLGKHRSWDIDSDIASDSRHAQFMNILTDTFEYKKDDVKYLLATYGEEFLIAKINLVFKTQTYKDGKIKNLRSYFEKMLEVDSPRPRDKFDESLHFNKKSDYEDFVLDKSFENFLLQSEQKRQSLLDGYNRASGKSVKVKIYSEIDEEVLKSNKNERRDFMQYLNCNKPDFGTGISFKDYITGN
jgi:hypothetical protein